MALIAAHEECWGSLLQGIGAEECGRLRDRSCRHFKSKFCVDCRWAMAVPVARVRVLTDELAYLLENRRSVGMWTVAPDRMGGFRYRIVNNTKGCAPPSLVVFEKPPPKCVPWTKLDAELVDDNGMVQLCIAKGTAVPIHQVKGRERVQFATRDSGSCTSSASSSPAPSRPSSPNPPEVPDPPVFPDAPTLCEVVVPSTLMQLSNSTVSPVELSPSSPTPSSSSRASPTPTVPLGMPPLSKREMRMQRNRASAATSRERKRKYVSYLEQQVCELERTVELLRQENWFWKSLEVDKYDPTCPLWVCEWF